MYKLVVPQAEMWDPVKEEFFIMKGCSLQLEHSLVSLSKWESKWNKPFLSKDKKTDEETRDYIRCMTVTQNVDPMVYSCMSQKDVEKVYEYINLPMTATTINNRNKSIGREIITAEIIYYWMITLNIPFECQKWHLNRLLTLIEVCSIKNSSGKKMSKKDIYAQNRALNEMRKKKHGTKG